MMDEVLRVLDEEVLPRYRSIPQFVGLVILASSTGARREVVGLSLWEGDVARSDAIIDELLERLYEIQGTSATSKVYDVVRLEDGRPQEPRWPRAVLEAGERDDPPWFELPGYDCACRVRIVRDAVFVRPCTVRGHSNALTAAGEALGDVLGVPTIVDRG